MWKEYIRFAHNQEVKSDPQSDIILEGNSCNRMASRVMTSANLSSVMSEQIDM